MADLLLLAGDYLPGWSGLWAAVTYGFEGGTWTEAEVRSICHDIVLGTDGKSELPRSDFYVFACGRFRVNVPQSPHEIDFEQFRHGQVLPSMNLGIYSLDGERLRLCLSEADEPRPSEFSSKQGAKQSLGELIRRG